MLRKLTPFKIKLVAVIACWVLTFYPIFELTRCIIRDCISGGWTTGWLGASLPDFYAEIGFMWFFYLLMPVFLVVMIDHAIRWGRHHAL